MLRVGHGYAVRDEGRLVATALALPYPPAFGWVSMVLVHAPYRRRGLATRLVERAMSSLEGAGLLPVLDATPAGAEVYARLGFRPVGNVMRWRGTSTAGGTAVPKPAVAARVRDLDRSAFGADRGAVLDDLSARPAPVAALATDGGGYLLSRTGRTATQLGPLVARDATTAVTLLAQGLDGRGRDRRRRRAGAGDGRCRSTSRPAASRRSVRSCGWRFAATRSRARPRLVHAIAGPELG